MEGFTIREIAQILGISPDAVTMRLKKAGIDPKFIAGRTYLFDQSVVGRIREVSKGGRPRKAPGGGK
jgi:predicted transcriptional regulator